MKYIKTFEKSYLVQKKKFKYEVGDYIKLLNDNSCPWNVHTIVKILSKESRTDYETPDYYVEAYKLEDNKREDFWVDEFDIERKLTPTEVKEFELERKYNL